MKVLRTVAVAFLFLVSSAASVSSAAPVASDASNVSSSPDPLSTLVEGEAASNAVASDTSSSPDPSSAVAEADRKAASQPSKNFDFGGFHFGGAAGNDGHNNGGGFAVDTLEKLADEGYDVKGTCTKMYPKPKLPDCDCRFVQDGELATNRRGTGWNRNDGAGAKDQCLKDTPGWKFDVCLKTSADIEGTRGKVTLYSPSSCTDTQDKIECVIEKFRFAPTYPRFGDTFIGFRATGRVFYDGNDGKGVQTHSCGVVFGRTDGKDQLDFRIEGQPFEDLQQSWIYPGVTAFVDIYRRFYSRPTDGPLLTSGSGDVVQDMKQCGLPVTG